MRLSLGAIVSQAYGLLGLWPLGKGLAGLRYFRVMASPAQKGG